MAIAFVRKSPNSTTPDVTTSGTSLTGTAFTSDQNDLIVAVAWTFHPTGGPALGAAQFLDSKANYWNLGKEALYVNYTGSQDLSVHIAFAVTRNFGASHTVTVQNMPSSSEITLCVMEFSGSWDDLALSTSSSATVTGVGTGIHLTSGSINPAGTSLLYVGGSSRDDTSVGNQVTTNNWTGSTAAFLMDDENNATGDANYFISSGSQQGDWTTDGTSTKYGVQAIIALAEKAAAGSYPIAWTKG